MQMVVSTTVPSQLIQCYWVDPAMIWECDTTYWALVSCLGQGPYFSKITYMVTACTYSKGLCSAVGLLSFFWFPLMANLGSIPAGDMFFISEINEWNMYFIRNLTVCYKDLWVSSPSLLFDSGVGAYNYEEKGQLSWVSLPITMHF